MFQHTGLTVNRPEEIRDFYEDVLGFELKRKFTLDQNISHKIFNEAATVDVYLMAHDDAQLEIFLSPLKEKKVFTHVCLAYAENETIYEKAVRHGYDTVVKENPGFNTYFIRDRSGNMFEVKKVTHSK